MDLAKKFIRAFCIILWKNPNELFGKPNTITNNSFRKVDTRKDINSNRSIITEERASKTGKRSQL